MELSASEIFHITFEKILVVVVTVNVGVYFPTTDILIHAKLMFNVLLWKLWSKSKLSVAFHLMQKLKEISCKLQLQRMWLMSYCQNMKNMEVSGLLPDSVESIVSLKVKNDILWHIANSKASLLIMHLL